MSEQAVNDQTKELDVNTEEQQDQSQVEGDGQQVTEDEGFEVIDGSEENATSTVPLKTFIKAKDKWKKREQQKAADAEALRQENELLRLQLEQSNKSKSVPSTVPRPEDYDTAEDHAKAVTEYIRAVGIQEAQKLLQQQQEEQARATRQAQLEETHDKVLNEFYSRAERLKAPDFEAAEEAFIQTFGRDAGLSLIRTIDNSEALVYVLGKNTAKAQAFAQQIKQDPVAGLVAITKYASNLSIKPRTPKSPPPDETESPSSGGLDLQKRYEKAIERWGAGKATREQLNAIRAEAREKGVRLT